MSSAVFRGTSYQCIGNFRYDLAIEPDGLTTFNANQTTDEASLGAGLIYLDDPDWKWKVLSDNTQELDNKLSAYHDYCFQCEFHSHCAGGGITIAPLPPRMFALGTVVTALATRSSGARSRTATGHLIEQSKFTVML